MDGGRVSGGLQMPAGRFGDLRVEIDGGDPGITEPMGQQGGVVAAARADFQDGVAVPYL